MIEPPPQGALAWPGTVGGSWPRAKIKEVNPCGKKPRGKSPMGIRIVEELFIVWEYCVQKKCVCTFLLFFERQRSKKIQATLQMTLFEFKILFDPTLGLQGGDKVQSKTFGQRVVISNSCKARCFRTLPFFVDWTKWFSFTFFLGGGQHFTARWND